MEEKILGEEEIEHHKDNPIRSGIQTLAVKGKARSL